MATPETGQPQPAKKGLGTLGWVLVGCGGALVVALIVAAIGGFLIYRKAKQAGLDPELMQKNPGLAVTRMIAAANPDVEIVQVDEAAGKVTLRQKSTGKTVRFSFDELKKGRVSFEGDEGEVVVETDPSENGGVRVTTPEGRVEWNAEAQPPDWFPVYPGAKVEGAFRHQSAGHTSGGFSFKSAAGLAEVAGFYRERLERMGLRITGSAMSDSRGNAMQILGGEAADGSRKVSLILQAAGKETSVAVTYETR